ncbi:hypothetical protein [Synechocystis sp. LKSZ1]|uniref:hypothetical protein n=1 Tax=Synechocystis sp. LKSZ1 TaxID=3144951 RepID=UPI00336BD138
MTSAVHPLASNDLSLNHAQPASPSSNLETAIPPLTAVSLSTTTLELAAQDVRRVLDIQREQNQILTTKLNILFVANGALLTTLSISHLASVLSLFSMVEVLGFLINFTLLIQAFLPRQTAVSPNLEDRRLLERYLGLGTGDYQLQMLVNLAETYHFNKQRLDDVSETLRFSAYVTWIVAVTILLHMMTVYFLFA